MYALCHDFVKTRIHPPKIYHEPNFNDTQFLELLRKSHDKIDNDIVKVNNFYDRIASSKTRKFRSRRLNRYNWDNALNFWENKVDFQQLASEIKEFVDNKDVRGLYEYVHNSKDLSKLSEAFEYGHTSLKLHLLLMANMIVDDYLKGKLASFLKNNANLEI